VPLKKTNIIKIAIIAVVAIVILASLSNNIKSTANDNLVAKFINSVFKSEEKDKNDIIENSTEVVNNDNKVSSSIRSESKDKASSQISSNEERLFEEISKQHNGIKVITSNDNVEGKWYRFDIHETSTSKKLGDFNYCDDLGHVDKAGNAIDGYSYLILNTTVECKEVEKVFKALSLKNLNIFFYNAASWEGGTELLTANVDAPMNSKSALMVKMKKGEKRNFNLVFLVEDKFINDKNVDFYLYINEYGAAPGTIDEYKSVVKLDYVR
jgi:putative uncharacterized protein (fragment)